MVGRIGGDSRDFGGRKTEYTQNHLTSPAVLGKSAQSMLIRVCLDRFKLEHFIKFLMRVEAFLLEMGPVAVEGGTTCKATSNIYKGLCLLDDSCDIVCKREGFHGGNCKGFLRKCICTNPC
ncbi:hypothetical protein Gohar_016332 [Gossypium harknessii]|uniref:Knottins-like domain-containing protein n=1 Tax=Gossypium harknessii TaxID=34285 RepID=A0A7J9G2I5_9ROSI|nr:hypothetical protein [Gossypium harknessii]